MKFCSNCGNQVPEGANVCPLCGTPMSGQPTMNQQTQQANTQPNQNYQSAARPVVQNKNIVTCILLSLVTCGIYGIIWFINMVDDVNRVCNDEKSNQSGGTVFLLTLVTCGIYGIIWFYQAGSRMFRAGQKYGMQISDNGTLYLILSIFGLSIVNYCLLQSDLNKFTNQ